MSLFEKFFVILRSERINRMILKYDVIIVGGGHAGCEAACSAANMGAKTCLVTMDMNKIAQMSCNPAIGGIAKGQIVREIDALGGQMGLVTDATSIQFRMLNVGKGPAVWSPRAQCDRGKFIWEWRRHLDATPNLDIWQDQADELLVENGEAIGIRTIWGAEQSSGLLPKKTPNQWILLISSRSVRASQFPWSRSEASLPTISVSWKAGK